MHLVCKSKIKKTDIQISFQKKRCSKATEEFLCSRMDEDNDSNLIGNLKSLASVEVKKLQANDANVLLVRIIQAIIINDDLEETLNYTTTNNEHESDGKNNATIVEIQNGDPPQGTSKQDIQMKKIVPAAPKKPKSDEKIVHHPKLVQNKKKAGANPIKLFKV